MLFASQRPPSCHCTTGRFVFSTAGRSVRVLIGLGLLIPAMAVAQQPLRHIEGSAIDLPAVIQKASLIVRGRVEKSETRWVGRTIVTFHELNVSETVKGARSGKVTVGVPGGSIGNVQTTWPGSPNIVAGDELVFFGVPAPDSESYSAVGLFDGLVKVHEQPNGSQLYVQPRGQPEPVETFLNEVRFIYSFPR